MVVGMRALGQVAAQMVGDRAGSAVADREDAPPGVRRTGDQRARPFQRRAVDAVQRIAQAIGIVTQIGGRAARIEQAVAPPRIVHFVSHPCVPLKSS